MFDKNDWSRKKTTVVTVQYLNAHPDLKAMKRAAIMEKSSMAGYAKTAIHEKLIRDGWLSQNITQGKIVK